MSCAVPLLRITFLNIKSSSAVWNRNRSLILSNEPVQIFLYGFIATCNDSVYGIFVKY